MSSRPPVRVSYFKGARAVHVEEFMFAETARQAARQATSPTRVRARSGDLPKVTAPAYTSALVWEPDHAAQTYRVERYDSAERDLG